MSPLWRVNAVTALIGVCQDNQGRFHFVDVATTYPVGGPLEWGVPRAWFCFVGFVWVVGEEFVLLGERGRRPAGFFPLE